MIANSHRTAIARSTLPVPTRWLLSQGLLVGKVMDYGCGKCASVNPPDWFNYDPYYQPNFITGARYDTIVCNYVLCTLPKSEEKKTLQHIQSRLRLNGVAYISVRNDVPRGGYGKSSKGTYQRKVTLPYLTLVRKTTQYKIYQLTKDDSLV